jgi:hypothetical protein
VRHEGRQAAANWSILAGGVLLFVSLFLTWSHQIPPWLPARLGRGALAGVRRAPDAWQVYSAADILLCLLAAGLGWCAVTRRRSVRWLSAGLAAGAMAFVAHAVSAPPTNGVLFQLGGRGGRVYGAAAPPSPGAGEVLALIALALALGGLALAGADALTARAGKKYG